MNIIDKYWEDYQRDVLKGETIAEEDRIMYRGTFLAGVQAALGIMSEGVNLTEFSKSLYTCAQDLMNDESHWII